MHHPRGERGSTLLDAVVGTALMLVVFVGIVGAFKLAIATVSNNKARAGAIALANERLEYIRSLAYDAVGTDGGVPAGNIAQSETVSLNDISYTRRTFISYEDDPGDGAGADDSNGVTADYKSAKVGVSWDARDGTHTVTLIARLSPVNGIESSVGGGTLSIEVRDAAAAPVANAQVRITNSGIAPAVDLTTFTDASGNASVIGAAAGSGYHVVVSKPGYSSAQTYTASATNTNPNPADLGVSESQTTVATFAIDLLSTKIIETYTRVTRATTTEPFTLENGIASSTDITVAGGVARLTALGGAYPPSGIFLSTVVSTSTLAQWREFTFVDSTPAGTDVRYRIYDANGAHLIPEDELPGNAAGFTDSPVDLTGIATSTYAALTVYATLTSGDASTTPTVDSWSISNDSGPAPLPNVALTLRGEKTIGSGPDGVLYKYDNQSLTSGASGSLTLGGLEFDSYTIGIADSSMVIASACGPQPEALGAGASQTTRLYFAPHTPHSLLVDVSSSGAPVSGASVRLHRDAPAYDETIASDACGQAFFSGIGAGSGTSAYTVDVSAPGHEPYNSAQVTVSGTTRLSVILN